MLQTELCDHWWILGPLWCREALLLFLERNSRASSLLSLCPIMPKYINMQRRGESKEESLMGDGHHKPTKVHLQLARISRQTLSWVLGEVTSRKLCYWKSLQPSNKERWWLHSSVCAVCALEGSLSALEAADRQQVCSAALGWTVIAW